VVGREKLRNLNILYDLTRFVDADHLAVSLGRKPGW
jgi:hypothetical protein